MKTNLPTTPGPYWYQEEGAKTWGLFSVDDHNGEGKLSVIGFGDDVAYRLERFPSGQWAKAHKPDEGIEAWAVFDSDGSFFHAGDSHDHAEQYANDMIEATEKKHTCEPVTIYRKERL